MLVGEKASDFAKMMGFPGPLSAYPTGLCYQPMSFMLSAYVIYAIGLCYRKTIWLSPRPPSPSPPGPSAMGRQGGAYQPVLFEYRTELSSYVEYAIGLCDRKVVGFPGPRSCLAAYA